MHLDDLDYDLSEDALRELLTSEKFPTHFSTQKLRKDPLNDDYHILFLGNPFTGEERSGSKHNFQTRKYEYPPDFHGATKAHYLKLAFGEENVSLLEQDGILGHSLAGEVAGSSSSAKNDGDDALGIGSSVVKKAVKKVGDKLLNQVLTGVLTGGVGLDKRKVEGVPAFIWQSILTRSFSCDVQRAIEKIIRSDEIHRLLETVIVDELWKTRVKNSAGVVEDYGDPSVSEEASTSATGSVAATEKDTVATTSVSATASSFGDAFDESFYDSHLIGDLDADSGDEDEETKKLRKKKDEQARRLLAKQKEGNSSSDSWFKCMGSFNDPAQVKYEPLVRFEAPTDLACIAPDSPSKLDNCTGPPGKKSKIIKPADLEKRTKVLNELGDHPTITQVDSIFTRQELYWTAGSDTQGNEDKYVLPDEKFTVPDIPENSTITFIKRESRFDHVANRTIPRRSRSRRIANRWRRASKLDDILYSMPMSEWKGLQRHLFNGKYSVHERSLRERKDGHKKDDGVNKYDQLSTKTLNDDSNHDFTTRFPRKKLVVVAHSFGCLVILELMKKYGFRPDKTIFLNPPIFPGSFFYSYDLSTYSGARQGAMLEFMSTWKWPDTTDWIEHLDWLDPKPVRRLDSHSEDEFENYRNGAHGAITTEGNHNDNAKKSNLKDGETLVGDESSDFTWSDVTGLVSDIKNEISFRWNVGMEILTGWNTNGVQGLLPEEEYKFPEVAPSKPVEESSHWKKLGETRNQEKTQSSSGETLLAPISEAMEDGKGVTSSGQTGGGDKTLDVKDVEKDFTKENKPEEESEIPSIPGGPPIHIIHGEGDEQAELLGSLRLKQLRPELFSIEVIPKEHCYVPTTTRTTEFRLPNQDPGFTPVVHLGQLAQNGNKSKNSRRLNEDLVSWWDSLTEGEDESEHFIAGELVSADKNKKNQDLEPDHSLDVALGTCRRESEFDDNGVWVGVGSEWRSKALGKKVEEPANGAKYRWLKDIVLEKIAETE